MTQEEIISGNKTICEFMGGIWMQDDYGDWGYEIDNPHWNKMQSIESLQYHSSWDWLIEVIEKIKGVFRRYKLDGEWMMAKEANSRLTPIMNELQNLNIINTHYCVVKFIEWYNQQTLNK